MSGLCARRALPKRLALRRPPFLPDTSSPFPTALSQHFLSSPPRRPCPRHWQWKRQSHPLRFSTYLLGAFKLRASLATASFICTEHLFHPLPSPRSSSTEVSVLTWRTTASKQQQQVQKKGPLSPPPTAGHFPPAPFSPPTQTIRRTLRQSGESGALTRHMRHRLYHTQPCLFRCTAFFGTVAPARRHCPHGAVPRESGTNKSGRIASQKTTTATTASTFPSPPHFCPRLYSPPFPANSVSTFSRAGRATPSHTTYRPRSSGELNWMHAPAPA